MRPPRRFIKVYHPESHVINKKISPAAAEIPILMHHQKCGAPIADTFGK